MAPMAWYQRHEKSCLAKASSPKAKQKELKEDRENKDTFRKKPHSKAVEGERLV